jgi:cell division protein FtsZ
VATSYLPVIKVIGAGLSGVRLVERMRRFEESEGKVELVACDAAPAELKRALEGAHLVFIVIGDGSGAAGAGTAIAEIAKQEVGALTVGLVVKPPESDDPLGHSLTALDELRGHANTTVVLPSEKLRTARRQSTDADPPDGVVDAARQAIKAVTAPLTVSGLINLDLADARLVLNHGGLGMVGFGTGSAGRRAVDAATGALASPSIEERLELASGILLTVSGGEDLSLYETNEAARVVMEGADPDANVVFSAIIEPALGDQVEVSLVATGFGQAIEPEQR